MYTTRNFPDLKGGVEQPKQLHLHYFNKHKFYEIDNKKREGTRDLLLYNY